MRIERDGEKKPRFLSLNFKLIFTYLILIVLFVAISGMYVSFFSRMYVISEAARTVETSAREFSRELTANLMFSFDTWYEKTRSAFQRYAAENFSLIVLDTHGNAVASFNDYLLLDEQEEFLSLVSQNASPGDTFVLPYDGSNYAISVRYHAPYTFLFFNRVMELSEYRGLIGLYASSIGAAAVIAITVALVFSTTMTRNIRKLKRRAELISDRKFDETVPIESNDEIGILAQSMENMAQSLQDYDTRQKTFLQNASHELRTPLMSIRGYEEGAKDGVFDDRDHVSDLVLDEVGRLEKLVDELMYLSKIENTEMTVELSPIRVEDLIDEAISRIAGIAVNQEIEVVKDGIMDLEMAADGERMVTALTNLLSNALRFAKKEIRVSMYQESSFFHIVVTDDGDGLNEDDLPHLFERFYKGKKGKYGLGLSIVSAIVKGHSGSILARNRNDGSTGAVFDMKFPIK